jgi:cell wall-associated NlpC family hydrolase
MVAVGVAGLTHFRHMQGQGQFSSRIRRPVGALLAAVAFGGVVVLGAPDAGSQSVEDKRAEAEQVTARIATLEAEYSELEEQARAATVELDEVQARVGEAETELVSTQSERDGKADELADYSVDAYVGGPAQDEMSAMLESDSEDVPLRLGYIGSVSGDRQQLLEDLNAAEEDVQYQVDELAAAEADAQELLDEIEQSQADAQATIDEQRDIEASLDAEIADLVAQQQAAAAAAAQAEAEAQAQAAAPQGGGGGGDDGGGGGGGGGGGSYTGPPPSVSPGAAGAVQAARSRIGAPYQWAGSGPDVFDCSGLTSWAWAQAGRGLPHSSRAQYSATRRVALSDLQPGDLVFYGSPIYHVGLYTGGGMMVDAPHTGAYVSERSIYAVGTPSGAGRP